MKDEVTGEKMSDEDWDNLDKEHDDSINYTFKIIDDADYDKVKRLNDKFVFKLICSFILGSICYVICNALSVTLM